MTRSQKLVATGAALGIAAMLLCVWTLATNIAAPQLADSNGDRLAFALPWLVVAVLPLFLMIAAIGNARFRTEAIDPTHGKEDRTMIVNGRVAENTLQQFVLFAVGLLALSVLLPARSLNLIPALAITFVLARTAFWIGYRIKPLYRAPGFAATANLNAGMLVAALWLWISGAA